MGKIGFEDAGSDFFTLFLNQFPKQEADALLHKLCSGDKYLNISINVEGKELDNKTFFKDLEIACEYGKTDRATELMIKEFGEIINSSRRIQTTLNHFNVFLRLKEKNNRRIEREEDYKMYKRIVERYENGEL